MRCKVLLLALTVVVACGAGPFRGGFIGRTAPVSAPTPAPVAVATAGQPRQAEIVQVYFREAANTKSTMTIKTLNPDAATLGSTGSDTIQFPGRQNCFAGKSYRLMLTGVPNRENLKLYPTLTVFAVTPRTRAYLEHNAIPVKFSAEDFDQVESGNFVTKVIFLPSPQFQNLALSGATDTIVNTQLPAGTDPIVEAQRRGAILAIIQIGNKDLELDGSANYEVSSVPTGPSQQFPIAGVNAPEFGTPASQDVPNPTDLPEAEVPAQKPVLLEEANPNPSTGVPAVQQQWGGDKF